MKKKILIATGGTGGHVIPATIFYEQLKDKFDVFLVTDKRGSKFLNFEKYKFDDFIIYLILGIIVGGRLGYVFFYNLPYLILYKIIHFF